MVSDGPRLSGVLLLLTRSVTHEAGLLYGSCRLDRFPSAPKRVVLNGGFRGSDATDRRRAFTITREPAKVDYAGWRSENTNLVSTTLADLELDAVFFAPLWRPNLTHHQFITDISRVGADGALQGRQHMTNALGGDTMSNRKTIDLKGRIQHIIDKNPYLGRRKLRCEESEGHVVLRGQVQSFFQKQMAQESVRNVDGIKSIENCLEVIK